MGAIQAINLLLRSMFARQGMLTKTRSPNVAVLL
jgi:hypothetical protein